MSSKILSNKDLDNYKDKEIDDLLSKLTEAEIEELNTDIDPDNYLLPPSQRCRDQTMKAPTGPFDREALIEFIEKKSKQEKDWEKNTAFESKVRGKVFNKKREDSSLSKRELEDMGFDMDLDDELNEALKNATEEELVDLAAILGFNGMLNQTQYHASLENKEQMCGGFQGVAKSETFKPVADEPDNDVDIESIITKLNCNDSELKEVNLNNVRDISEDQFKELFDALLKNKNLKKFHCANTHLKNTSCESLIEVLKKNNTLTVLNLESNYLNGDTVLKVLEAINRGGSAVVKLRLMNQQQKGFGVRVEQEIIKFVKENKKLQVLGLDLETAEARIRVRDHLVENVDRHTRQSRLTTH